MSMCCLLRLIVTSMQVCCRCYRVRDGPCFEASEQPKGGPDGQGRDKCKQRHLAGRHGGSGSSHQAAATTLLAASRRLDRAFFMLGRRTRCCQRRWRDARGGQVRLGSIPARFFLELRLGSRFDWHCGSRTSRRAVPHRLPALTEALCADAGPSTLRYSLQSTADNRLGCT